MATVPEYALQPAFPSRHREGNSHTDNGYDWFEDGMLLLDYFAAHAPEPTSAAIQFEADRDKARNPHGDTYKPPRRSMQRIVGYLKYRYAIGMMEARAAALKAEE